MSAQVMDVNRQFIVYYPLGDTIINGVMRSHRDVAVRLLEELKVGNSIAIPLYENGWRIEEVGQARKIYYSLRTYNVEWPEREWESDRKNTLKEIRDVAKERLKDGLDLKKYNHRIVEVTERDAS